MKRFFGIIPVAFAQGNANPCTSLGSFSTLCNLTSNDFGLVVSTALNIILIFTIILSVFYFLYGGVRWIISRGDKEKVEDARNHIVASLVGLILAFLAFFIVNIAFGFFFPGKSLKDLSLPTLGPDTIPPTVSIAAPISDSTVSGLTTIQASATDNKQVTRVEFYVDDVLKNTDTKEPFSYAWDTKFFRHNSSHTILAKAYDAAGNVGTSTPIGIVIIDITKPTVSIINPANNQKIPSNSTFTLSATASDISSIAQVEFRVNGVLKYTDYNAPYTCIWQVPPARGITYRIEVSAIDTAGNIGKVSNSATTTQ
jgi:hypothetical protein